MATLVSQIEATTKKYHDPGLVDATADRSYYFAKLMKRARTFLDGRSYTWPLEYARKSIQCLGEYELLDRVPLEQITQAEEQFVWTSIACMLSDQEIMKNKGKERILNLLSKKMSMLGKNARSDLATLIWTGDGPASKQPTGLDIWVDVNGTSDTTEVATITRGTDDVGAGTYLAWFCNQAVDGSGGLTLNHMENCYLTSSHGDASPDAIITDKVVFRYIWNLATPLQREPHSDAAKLGFKSMNFNGVPLVWDDDVPYTATTTRRIYMFHMADHQLMFLKGGKMHRTPWHRPEDQRAIVCDLYNDFCFIVENPRNQGVIYDIAS